MAYNYWMLLGVLIGVLLRTIGPYLVKLAQGGAKFDIIYLRSAIVAAIFAVLGGGFTLPALAPDAPPQVAIWLGISTGYALQSIIRTGEKAVTPNAINP